MKHRVVWLVLAAALSMASACGDEATETPAEDPLDEGDAPAVGAYAICEAEDHVGTLAVKLAEQFTSVQGQVADGVRPISVSVVSATSGACRLVQPPTLFCDPTCSGGTTCAADGSCVPLASNQDVGQIVFEGLSDPVEIEARAPTFFYNFIGDLTHPGFSPDSEVILRASGGSISGFAMAARGVAELTSTMESADLAQGAGVPVTWAAGEDLESVKVELELNIANHGGTPAQILCTVDDTGSFTIPAALSDQLLDLGFSGFPSLRITRQGAAAATTDFGCVDLRVQSELILSVEIPGLTSCSFDEDCPDGQACLSDLTCG